ncbi:MAG: M48 family metalloprotease, partial [Candidatus Babeliales bacterium]
MIKKLLVLLACCTISVVHGKSINETFVYRQELDQLKSSAQYNTLFNKHMPASLQYLQRDIYNYSKLTFAQRLIRFIFLAFDTIVVTPETMPALYAYTQKVCDAAHIPMPVIFLTRENTLYNAAAQKLFLSTGGIIIGQELLNDVTDDELEAIIAHEIGHIKHNHINKHMAINIAVVASAPI